MYLDNELFTFSNFEKNNCKMYIWQGVKRSVLSRRLLCNGETNRASQAKRQKALSDISFRYYFLPVASPLETVLLNILQPSAVWSPCVFTSLFIIFVHISTNLTQFSCASYLDFLQLLHYYLCVPACLLLFGCFMLHTP